MEHLTLEGIKRSVSNIFMSNNLQLNDFNEGLHFLSLGGIGEIGANCYLYGCDENG